MSELQSREKNVEQRHPRTIVLLHWLVAASVFFLFISSWWMLSLPLPSSEFIYRELPFQLHKNIGITLFLAVLALAVTRVITSMASAKNGKTWLERLALWDHILIYFLLALCCLSGYMSSSYSGWATSFWWLVDFPSWSAENDELNILFSDIHMFSCWALLGVILLHICAALYHAFGNDGLVDRMFRLR